MKKITILLSIISLVSCVQEENLSPNRKKFNVEILALNHSTTKYFWEANTYPNLFTYSPAGNLETFSSTYIDSNIPKEINYKIVYDGEGKIDVIKNSEYFYPQGNGYGTKQFEREWYEDKYYYDNTGNVIRIERTISNPEQYKGIRFTIIKFEYKNNQLKKLERFRADQSNPIEVRTYEKGELVSILREGQHFEVLNGLVINDGFNKYKYNDNGDIIEKSNSNYIFYYSYDDKLNPYTFFPSFKGIPQEVKGQVPFLVFDKAYGKNQNNIITILR